MNYAKFDNIQSDTIICFVYEDNRENELLEYLNTKSNNEINKQIEAGIFQGKYLEKIKLALENNLKVILKGLGKYDELTRKKLSIAAAEAARFAKNTPKNNSIAFGIVRGCDFDETESVKIITTGLNIGLYKFDKYINEKEKKINELELVENNINENILKSMQEGLYIAQAMNFAKDLVNEPAQIATPEYIAEIAEEIAKENNLEFEVFDDKQCAKMGMNAFLAVGQGSVNKPKFIHLTYKPKNTPKKKIALVGKGITFDAGGMNIKPATSMLTMKSDMTGAASVLGIIQAIARLNSDIELHVVSALCENMTSGKAYKQGDILRAMNGKTIEVDNTDAEGRITLADALTFCDDLDVDEVIDIATLTGAVIVSLGHNITGVLGNNQEQIDKFLAISKKSCENTWQMPILDELKDNLKSEIADFKNTGGRNAGTSTAGWFLSNFTKSEKWLHLDIAGTAYLDKSNKETLSGPTGVMIRSLINYLTA